MNKLIIKTALITMAALAVAAAAVFSLWLVCSPSTMADACEKTGNYPLAVTCADLSYKYSGKTEDLARCAENSILSGNDKLIVSYGDRLIASDDFDTLCIAKDKLIGGTDYAQFTSAYNVYIRGHVAAAHYRGGDADKAVAAAEAGGARAFTKLVLAIAERGDRAAAEKVLSVLENMENSEKLTEILKKI